jgi:formylglycine-generating enzyme required for sulfatase activity
MAGRKQQLKHSRAARTPETTRLKPGLLVLAAFWVGGGAWWWSVSSRPAPMSGSTSVPDVVATVANAGTAPGQPPGGSYLCTDQYCSRYMVGTRGKGEGSTATNHVGFRLVRAAR